MHVRQTPSQLVVRHHPRFAAAVALLLGCLAVGSSATILLLGSGPMRPAALLYPALLVFVGTAVLLSEPRLKMWVFDRRTQQMFVLRRGWLGALRPEATADLREIQDAFHTAESSAVSPQLRRLDGHTQPLFEGDFLWDDDRRAAVKLVRTFLGTNR